MDPHVVFDCQNILPNRFALSLAAAARTRALRRGAEPRLDPRCASASEMALQEIACGAFADDEMAPFLKQAHAFCHHLHPQKSSFAATAFQALPPHPSPHRMRRSIDDVKQQMRRNERC
ncbi:hypothetical protein NXC14_CH01323 [Rhizobium sp. NXC14]|uniref:DNA-directed RNA polymerase subunit omega n=1 Tax=Rhizobium sp. NXC14 TaxID=1981173 RepID=UPI000A204F0A|nr:DNA-directed RNA polymerase subunit omega [Rhizobium sp. NXC14]ARO29310.1 hypothetical protein NXC14_CH01323 [Rhizobium sp. NXC14]